MSETGDLTKAASITPLLLPTEGTQLQTCIYLFCVISEILRKPWPRCLGQGRMGTKLIFFLLSHHLVWFYTHFIKVDPYLACGPVERKVQHLGVVCKQLQEVLQTHEEKNPNMGCQNIFFRFPASSKLSYQATAPHQSHFSGLAPATWWPWKFAFAAMHPENLIKLSLWLPLLKTLHLARSVWSPTCESCSL